MSSCEGISSLSIPLGLLHTGLLALQTVCLEKVVQVSVSGLSLLLNHLPAVQEAEIKEKLFA